MQEDWRAGCGLSNISFCQTAKNDNLRIKALSTLRGNGLLTLKREVQNKKPAGSPREGSCGVTGRQAENNREEGRRFWAIFN